VASFPDVAPSAYFADAVNWLVANGITSGINTPQGPIFGPDRAVTRAQMASFLHRMMGEPNAPTSCSLSDENAIPANVRQAVCWLRAEQITQANPYRPLGTVTRGEMALFLSRLAQAALPSGSLCGFRDTPTSGELASATCWMKAQFITNGLDGDATRYGPSVAVTRGQMAAFLSRVASTPEIWFDNPPPSARFDCEILDPRSCLLPFPSNHFTRPDNASRTGVQLNFDRQSMIRNSKGVRVDPTDQNRSDGFSPGSALLVHLPSVDLTRSGAAPITDIGSYDAPDTPVVIINKTTGERHPHWVELDAQVTNDADRITFIRPARNFEEGATYVVGLRNLVDSNGVALEPSEAFDAIRDGRDIGRADVDARRADVGESISFLETQGVNRNELYLAWEFTVASAENISGRLLKIRDETFDLYANKAPTAVVTATPTTGDCAPTQLRCVTGILKVPNYLTGSGGPGARFNLGPDGLPRRTTNTATSKATLDVTFWCAMPANVSGANPTRMVLAGHGLLGSGSIAQEDLDWAIKDGNLTICAVDLWGLSFGDLASGAVLNVLSNLSDFPTLPDRGQQAILNTLVLGRALKDPRGLASLPPSKDGDLPPFKDAEGRSVLDHDQLFYIGLSQGGIMGGAIMAVAQDFDRGLLGVPGMNYSTLLDRSVLGRPFTSIINGAYGGDPIERSIGSGIVQILWDRSEANGYAQHITSNPYPDTPAKDILVFMAFADEAVANVTTEVMARTMNIPLRQPALTPGRSPDVEPFWNIEPLTTFPHQGSGMLIWDFGNPAPPTTNTGPSSTPGFPDPHGAGARLSALRTLIDEYLAENGPFRDVCNGNPCAGPRDL
jgi:hypothetical protein